MPQTCPPNEGTTANKAQTAKYQPCIIPGIKTRINNNSSAASMIIKGNCCNSSHLPFNITSIIPGGRDRPYVINSAIVPITNSAAAIKRPFLHSDPTPGKHWLSANQPNQNNPAPTRSSASGTMRAKTKDVSDSSFPSTVFTPPSVGSPTANA